MAEETFKTKGTCSVAIHFTRDGDKIRNIHFDGEIGRASCRERV